MPELDLSEFLPKPNCAAMAALESLTEKDRVLFVAAFAHPKVPHAKIVERFSDRGVNIGKDAISRHRKGSCACGRS